MLTLPIEAEIEQEHKVIRNLNKRQTVCVGIITGTALISYALSENVLYTILVTAPIGCCLAYFGWKITDGLKAEEILWRRLQKILYKNGTRKYRTKNSYFELMNSGYAALRNKDMSNRRIAGKIKKAEKYRKTRKGHSRLKKVV